MIELVKNFWKVEDSGIYVEHDSFVKKFENSSEYKNNKYTVKLHWEVEYKNIPDNFVPARNRLLSLSKPLKKSLRYHHLPSYRICWQSEVIRHREVHYNPHRKVIKEERATTKLRIVYDASAIPNGPSIKESLHSGRPLLPKIFDVLLWFRFYKFAILSDIQSSFLNIRAAEEDRDFLRFLWVKDIDQKYFELVKVSRRLCLVWPVLRRCWAWQCVIMHWNILI